MELKRNVHAIDRMIRLPVSLASIYVGIFHSDIVGHIAIAVILVIFGLINLFAVAFGYCPIYHVTGLSTQPAKSEITNQHHTP
jgi:hypothetical protein